MIKQKIELFDYAKEITDALKKGVLLTTKAEKKVNTMTISWGQLGIEWNRPIFTIFVRTGRCTHEQLLKHGEFTINIPFGKKTGKILGVCGTKSGYQCDKIAELDLTLVDGEEVSVPAIAELPLTLECKVLYSQLQDHTAIPEKLRSEFYPEDVASDFHGANRDFHTAFYGEVVAAYVLKI